MMELSPLDRALRAARRGHEVAARALLDDVLASDPTHEEALLWRARVAVDDGERAGFLQRVLAVNPGNRWAAQQLEASGGAAASGARGSAGAPDTLQCPNCGGSVEVHPERGSKAAMCTYCGSVLDLGTRQLDIIGQMNPKVGPKHPIKPGDEATFFGENHLVMGWMRYKGWDDESSWQWDEWQLVSETGVPRYLSHSSDEGWTIQTPIRPTPEIGSRFGMMWIDVPGGKVTVTERSPAKITAMQGEFTFRPQLGATLQVIEASGDGQHYSAETTATEREVVGGPRIPERELWAAFGREDKLREMDERAERTRRRRKAVRRAALLCFLAAGVYFLGIGWAAAKGGTVVSSSTTEFVSDLASVPALPPLEGQTIVRRDSLSVGTVEVSTASETYQVTIETDRRATQTEVYVEEPGGAVSRLGQLTRQNSGSRLSQAFRPNTSGTHTLLLFVGESSPDQMTFATTVRTGMWDPGPFAMACGLAALLGAVLFLSGGFGRID